MSPFPHPSPFLHILALPGSLVPFARSHISRNNPPPPPTSLTKHRPTTTTSAPIGATSASIIAAARSRTAFFTPQQQQGSESGSGAAATAAGAGAGAATDLCLAVYLEVSPIRSHIPHLNRISPSRYYTPSPTPLNPTPNSNLYPQFPNPPTRTRNPTTLTIRNFPFSPTCV